MTPQLRTAIQKLRAAINEVFDAVLGAMEVAERVAAEVAPRPTATKVPPARPTRGGLPTPLTPPPPVATKARVELDPVTRASNLPGATQVAKDVVKMIGATSPVLVSGVKGQLALKRIEYDDQLVAEAIMAAKG